MPLDNLYLVLVSSKASNIIEDQETIKLLYKVIMLVCSEGINEGNRKLTQTTSTVTVLISSWASTMLCRWATVSL